MEENKRWREGLYYAAETGLMLDIGGMGMEQDDFAQMEDEFRAAFAAMAALERGEIANPSEGRRVGHYWLRSPDRAPTEGIRRGIEETMEQIHHFVQALREGAICGASGRPFRHVIVAGVGGSSLGTEFVYHSLPPGERKLALHFMDNTDPAGMDAVFETVAAELEQTMVIVISKSGGTTETRNCMEEARAFYEARGLSFPKHAVSVSEAGSALDAMAAQEGWLARFYLWDWVGGRCSVTSAVGLLPLALAGVDIKAFLRGAADCDALTRRECVRENPAALLAQSWHHCSGGKGGSTMVVLPYKDALALFAKYLQQLVMESLGKEEDVQGKPVYQGLAVLGNKGSSDQHSYMQQIISSGEGSFVTLVEVLQDRAGASPVVGEESSSGDFLQALMLGTKKALEAKGRKTLLLTIPAVNPYYVGLLIALFERAVGLYASLIGINAYDQPAVEQGKRAAKGLIDLKNRVRAQLSQRDGGFMNAAALAAELGAEAEDVFRLLRHLAANDPQMQMREKAPIWESEFARKGE